MGTQALDRLQPRTGLIDNEPRDRAQSWLRSAPRRGLGSAGWHRARRPGVKRCELL